MDVTTNFGTVKIKLLKGEKGDKFQYEDYTPEELESLRGPQGEPFKFEDFTEQQLAELRADVASVYYKKEEATYHTTGTNTTSIDIPITGYTEKDMLFVDIEGLALTEGVDYTIDGSKLVLTEPITHRWTAVNFRALRAIAITANDYDKLKSDSFRAYETVADMQAATDLAVGMTAHTNGFHASGDGGAAYYTISASGTANGMDVLALQGGLRATLVVTEAYVKPEMFGAYGDGTHDDTACVQRCLDVAKKMQLVNTYKITSDIYNNRFIDISGLGNKSVITSESNYRLYINNKNSSIQNRSCDIGNFRLYNVTIFIGETQNDVVFGASLHDIYWGLTDIWCIELAHKCAFQTFNNLFAENVKGLFYCHGDIDGSAVINSGSTMKFSNCVCANASIAGMYIDGTGADGFSYSIDNCSFEHAPHSIYATGTIRGRLDLYLENLHGERNTQDFIYSDTSQIAITAINPWCHLDDSATVLFNIAAGNLVVKGGYLYRNNIPMIQGGASFYYTPDANFDVFNQNLTYSDRPFTGKLFIKNNTWQKNLDAWSASGDRTLISSNSILPNSFELETVISFVLTELPTFAVRYGSTNILTYAAPSSGIRYIKINLKYIAGSVSCRMQAIDASYGVVYNGSRTISTDPTTVKTFSFFSNKAATFEEVFNKITC